MWQTAGDEHGHQCHCTGGHDIPDPPAGEAGDDAGRADAHQQTERPRRLGEAHHPAPPLVRDVVGDPRGEPQVEGDLALAEHHQGDSEHHHTRRPGRQGSARGNANETRPHRRAPRHTIHESGGHGRRETGQFGDGEGHPDVVERHVETAGDGGEERWREPVAGVREEPGGGEQPDVAADLGRFLAGEQGVDGTAEHDRRR